MADPGFTVGGGRGLPRRLHFENFVSKRKNLDYNNIMWLYVTLSLVDTHIVLIHDVDLRNKAYIKQPCWVCYSHYYRVSEERTMLPASVDMTFVGVCSCLVLVSWTWTFEVITQLETFQHGELWETLHFQELDPIYGHCWPRYWVRRKTGFRKPFCQELAMHCEIVNIDMCLLLIGQKSKMTTENDKM